jgi:AraC-like DNA-binding protein
VIQVASEVGYDSEAAFNRAFKREFVVPPGKFRRTIQAITRGARSGWRRTGQLAFPRTREGARAPLDASVAAILDPLVPVYQ